MFTDRFIKLPVDLFDTKEADMIGYDKNTKSGETVMRFLPFELSHYRPSNNNDDEELTHTLVHMKNGDSFHTSISIEEFEKLLNAKTEN